jgi:hypothetical protein
MSFPATEVKNYRIVFKEKLSEAPRMITFSQSEKIKDLWKSKETIIELGNLAFSFSDIQKIEKIDAVRTDLGICFDTFGTICGKSFKKGGVSFLPYARKRMNCSDLSIVSVQYGYWENSRFIEFSEHERSLVVQFFL